MQNEGPRSPAEIPLDRLAPQYRERLTFPADYDKAYQKAAKIAKQRAVTVSDLQQAILVLEFRSEAEITATLRGMFTLAGMPADWKAAEIELIKSHCQSQEDFIAFLGIKKFNSAAVIKHLEKLTVENLGALLDHLNLDELENIVSGYYFDEFIRTLREEKIDRVAIQRFHSIFSPDERKSFLKKYPQILFRLGASGDLNERNLANFQLIDPEIRLKILEAGSIQWWLKDVVSDAAERIEYLKELLGNAFNAYLTYAFESSVLTADSWEEFKEEVDQVVGVLHEVFGPEIPWQRIYPNEEKSRSSKFSLVLTHPEKIRTTVATLGKAVTQELLQREGDYFLVFADEKKLAANPDLFKDPLLIRLRELTDEKTMLDLIKSDSSLRYLDQSFDLDQMNALITKLGIETFIRLLKSFLSHKFLKRFDRIENFFGPEMVDQIIERSKKNEYILYQISDYFDFSGNWAAVPQEYLAPIFNTSRELFFQLTEHHELSDLRLYDGYGEWLMQMRPDVAQKVIEMKLTPHTRTLAHEFYHAKNIIQMLIDRLGSDGFLKQFSKRTALRSFLALTPDQVVRGGEFISTLDSSEIEMLLESGLLVKVIKAPEKYDEIRHDIGGRLESIFQVDPLIRSQAETIVTRLEELEAEGKNIDSLIRVLRTRLSQPQHTEIEKIWLLYSRIMGKTRLLAGSDPQLEDASFQERVRVTHDRLLDIHELSIDQKATAQAHQRNAEFAANYTPQAVFTEPVLVHGKAGVFAADAAFGFRSSDFLGAEQYPWVDVTANALNCMALFPDEQASLVEGYRNQKDDITIRFGASNDKPKGITHIFRFSDAEQAFSRQRAAMYDCKIHSTSPNMEHKLIWVGLPTTAELAAFIPTTEKDWVETVKRYYAKQSFYVPLLDVKTGEIVFTESAYHQLRAELLKKGEVVEMTNQDSVEALSSKLLEYYSEQDAAHGTEHINQALTHLSPVCREIFAANPDWFGQQNLEYQEFENLVKIAVVGHDIQRGKSEDEEHAITGAAELVKLVDSGLAYSHLQLITNAIKQHNLPREARWSDDPVTQALYDIDKADTKTERGADSSYIKLVLPTIVTGHTKEILNTLLTSA